MYDLNTSGIKGWHVGPAFKIIDRDNFGYRVEIVFENGSKKMRQYSGFATKHEAEEARQHTEGELVDGTYVVDDHIKLADFLEYWLENDIRQRVGSANTYDSYSCMTKRHIIPVIGDKKLAALHQGDIHRLYKICAEESKSIARQVKVVMNVSLDYALKCHLVTVNVAKGISLPKSVEPEPYHGRNIDSAKTLTMEQIQRLIVASKDTPIHMQILFNVLMGLRRQEINAVKYTDVDYVNHTLTVERQLGKKLSKDSNGNNERPTTKNELPLKTYSSRRVLPIPDYVFEAILEERKTYEKNRSRRRKYFLDENYICCSTYGKPRSKDFHWSHYKKLLQDTGLPDIRWHDLRKSYCTLLLKNDFSPKAVSKLMGHAKELITVDVYGDNDNIIPEEMPELVEYMADVMPTESEQAELAEGLLDVEIDVEQYLPGPEEN